MQVSRATRWNWWKCIQNVSKMPICWIKLLKMFCSGRSHLIQEEFSGFSSYFSGKIPPLKAGLVHTKSYLWKAISWRSQWTRPHVPPVGRSSLVQIRKLSGQMKTFTLIRRAVASRIYLPAFLNGPWKWLGFFFNVTTETLWTFPTMHDVDVHLLEVNKV